MIDFTCSCGQELRARGEMAGKWGTCNKCGAKIQVPENVTFESLEDEIGTKGRRTPNRPRFPVLVFLSRALAVIGWGIGILSWGGCFWAFSLFIGRLDDPQYTGSYSELIPPATYLIVFGALVWAIIALVLLAMSEWTKVFLAIEENTRDVKKGNEEASRRMQFRPLLKPPPLAESYQGKRTQAKPPPIP